MAYYSHQYRTYEQTQHRTLHTKDGNLYEPKGTA